MVPESAVALLPDETLDTMFHGRLQVIQKKRGYRFSLDAVILGRWARVFPGARVLDLGTGCGIIALIVAASTEAKEIVGVEIQEELADIALRNVRLNGFSDVVTIKNEDLKKLPSLYPPGFFDCIITNPPFRELDSGRLNPNEQKTIARHEIAVSLKQMLEGAFRLVKARGSVFLIYPARRLVDLFYEMRKCGLEPKNIQCVHSRSDEPASMILVEGAREGGVDLNVKEPLVVYDSEGDYTEALQDIYSFS
jgi:tRNA1Val (adenine37-N6)-methyltransferase